jgi:hypothetical protein
MNIYITITFSGRIPKPKVWKIFTTDLLYVHLTKTDLPILLNNWARRQTEHD